MLEVLSLLLREVLKYQKLALTELSVIISDVYDNSWCTYYKRIRDNGDCHLPIIVIPALHKNIMTCQSLLQEHQWSNMIYFHFWNIFSRLSWLFLIIIHRLYLNLIFTATIPFKRIIATSICMGTSDYGSLFSDVRKGVMETCDC